MNKIRKENQMELARTEKARLVQEKLARLRHRQNTRWRMKDQEFGGVNPFWTAALISVITFSGIMGIVWHPLWIITGVCLGIIAERNGRNLYEWKAIRSTKKRIAQLTASEDIFEVDSWLLDQWRNTVRRLGGNPENAWFAPERNVGVFEKLSKLHGLMRNEHTTPQLRSEIITGIQNIMSEAIRPSLEPSQLEEKSEEILAIEMRRSDQEVHE